MSAAVITSRAARRVPTRRSVLGGAPMAARGQADHDHHQDQREGQAQDAGLDEGDGDFAGVGRAAAVVPPQILAQQRQLGPLAGGGRCREEGQGACRESGDEGEPGRQRPR